MCKVYVATDDKGAHLASGISDALFRELNVETTYAWWASPLKWPARPRWNCPECERGYTALGAVCPTCNGSAENQRYTEEVHAYVAQGQAVCQCDTGLRRQAVLSADLVIILLRDYEHQSSMHVELGVALAFDTPVLLFGHAYHFDSPSTCPHYFAPQVRRSIVHQDEVPLSVGVAAVRHWLLSRDPSERFSGGIPGLVPGGAGTPPGSPR